MKPYYEEHGITIYHGDCREVLPELGKFDLLLTDPPYGIGASRKAFGSDRKKQGSGVAGKNGFVYQPKQFEHSGWDDAPVDQDLLNAARALCRDQCIWGGNYFHLPPSMRWLVWDKRNDGTCFADCELAWTNQRKAVRIFRYLWSGMMQEHAGRWKEPRVHPTMKPLPLMAWCLSHFPDTRTVFDPFMGSGTTLRAAKDAGLQATGIELNEKYCEIAAKRLSQSVLQFTPEEDDVCRDQAMGFDFSDWADGGDDGGGVDGRLLATAGDDYAGD